MYQVEGRDSSSGKMGLMSQDLSKAVFVRVSDGLGNQMFQYAAGRALAFQYRTVLVLEPVSEYFKWFRPSRRFALPHFKLSQSVRIHYPRLGSRASSNAPTLKELNAYQFQADIVESKLPVRIEGFFQSEDYFKNMPREILFQEFGLKDTLSHQAGNLKNKILQTDNSICLHMRLADYKTSGIFAALNETYYRAALENVLRQLTGSPAIWVFSNGTKEEVSELCKKSGIWNAKIQTDEGIPEWELLHVMSACQHHIIANSTFSWWAAWLKGTQGITMMPSQWFKEPSWEAKGLRVLGWCQI